MSDQRRQILQMLAENKIRADEADRLLEALESESGAVEMSSKSESGNGSKPKFLHVKVNSEPGSGHKHENVDIKIPLLLLKAGIKLHSFIPAEARTKINSHLAEKGVNFDISKLDSEHLDQIIQALTESSIDIDADNEKVRIYCE